ncbi:MAG: hypothetical protein QOE76_1479 [Frankiales bacterium]|jgi:hypothetical protein|nr:hypothetical protein [Frankiales bacterium]
MPRHRSPALTILVALVVLAVVIGGFVVVLITLRPGPVVVAGCTVATYQMDPEQAQNAAVIAAVAEARGLPHHAVTIAIAVAMQESRLRNLDHGDRDSLGVFQQRPSQGWGTAAQVQDPVYAAGAFYDRLVKVPNWQTVAVTVAGQAVQHSGLPTAYAQWEPRATAMAKALTGEVAAGMTCQYAKSDVAVPSTGLSTTMQTDATHDQVGPLLGVDLAADRGWLAVGWLLSHAETYQLAQVSYAGQTWSATKGTWSPAATTSNRVTVVRTQPKA